MGRSPAGLAKLLEVSFDQVVETYATGGPHFAFTTPPAPDEPPPLAEPIGTPVQQAHQVIEKLGAWLTARHGKTVRDSSAARPSCP